MSSPSFCLSSSPFVVPYPISFRPFTTRLSRSPASLRHYGRDLSKFDSGFSAHLSSLLCSDRRFTIFSSGEFHSGLSQPISLHLSLRRSPFPSRVASKISAVDFIQVWSPISLHLSLRRYPFSNRIAFKISAVDFIQVCSPISLHLSLRRFSTNPSARY